MSATLRQLLLGAASAWAATAGAVGPSPLRPVATYSIVARDAQTGELGVAVQSHWFSVGSLVSWAQAGVGAVATQSFVDPSYGPLGLALMESGRDAQAALAGLLAADAAPQVRQVAMIDARGQVAVHTGSNCIPFAGHRSGEGYSVQANLMATDRVPAAMAEAFETARGDLAARLLAALQAAERVGGDIRGKQSAAVRIVRGSASGAAWQDVVLELRVEDHQDPLGELERLLQMHRGYTKLNEGDLAVERGDLAAARSAYGAAEALLPGNLEARFWHGVALLNAGEIEAGQDILRAVIAADARWAELLPRLVPGGFLRADASLLQRLLAP
jgi:uncharacterized Ntn-hydrolase superfamily protein